MESNATRPEKDCGALGVLFQTIINDLRGSSPIWEDFIYKSMKLHTSLKSTMVAITSFLEAFQKVADMATGSKGATKEIGSALTRLCMRHKSIESHLQAFTSSIVNCLAAPLQDKLEDWKKAVATLDKDHAKEYKKARQDIKKAASDTMRLQKKVKKGGGSGASKTDMQLKLDTAMQDVTAKYQQLEETEKNSVRSALIEERSRFCHFITCLKPFVDQELKLLTEVTHIHEIMDNLCYQAAEPAVLPASSEQVILDLKGLDNSAWNFNQQPSPPSSPSSLGSRKSSMCSINSINSSSSGSSKSHSPSHTMHKRTPSQASSNQDKDGDGDCDSTPTTPSDNTPSASSTWNNWPNPPGAPKIDPTRPHTISSAYEKGHGRPALKPDMFEPPATAPTVEMRPKTTRSQSQSGPSNQQNRPSATISKMQPVLPPHSSKPKVMAVAPPVLPPGAQPIYANMSEISQRSSQSENSPDDGEPTTPTTLTENSGGQGPQSPVVLMNLDEAIEQMDLCTASLNIQHQSIPEENADEVTPRSQNSDSSSVARESLFENTKPKLQQDTSLELAKAIRELEASTAALTSAYDNDSCFVNNNPPTAAPASGDTDSYTSKSSLPTSSGYGTMNSTPAGSEDTIASGGSHETNVKVSENADQEEVDGEGIPLSGNALARRSSVNTQKPPPPVRRTASVAGSAPSHVQKLRSPPRQMSESTPQPMGAEGPYAELQLIQQSIQQQQQAANIYYQQNPPQYGQQQMAPNSAPVLRPGEDRSCLTRAVSYPAPPGMYAAPNEGTPAAATSVIQSLNAKFASLNSQYQEEQGDGGPEVRPAGQGKAPPPAIMQKPKVIIPPPPPSAMGGVAGSHYAPIHVDGNNSSLVHGHHISQGHHPQLAHLQHQRNVQGQQQSQHHPQYNQPPGTGHNNQQHNPYQHYHLSQHQSPPPPPPPPPQGEEDFPMPPTVEELQEMERVYSRPPPVNATRAPPTSQKPTQVKRPSISANPQETQHSLMMELKRRVSVDDTSEA